MVSLRNLLLFGVLCLIWGTTWIGIKAGVQAVPPLLFAGTRFTAAGVILLAVEAVSRGLPQLHRRDLPRLAISSVLMISLCYGPLFWGMIYVDSGTAAVLELSLTPIALMGFAVLLGEEAIDRRRLAAIVIGIAGLAILFGPTAYASWSAAAGESLAWRLIGSAAVASAAFTYGWGSVLARPLLRSYSASFVAGVTTLVGGVLLLLASLGLEPGASAALDGRWGLAAWCGWLFLVLFGSLIGYTIYMRLLKEIGPTRAGTYAFVSPAIAVVLGIVCFGERLHLLDVVGMSVMLVAAALAMFDRPPRLTAAEITAPEASR